MHNLFGLILLFRNLAFYYECDSIFVGFLLVVDLCLLAWLHNFIKGFGLLVYSGDRRLEICFVIRNIV